MKTESYDAVILGAGLYGLFSALRIVEGGGRALVLEADPEPFSRATFVNQARVHMGYHYPRSISTARKSAHYFNRFLEDYGFCVLTSFDQVYATSASGSWTTAAQFEKFCRDARIPCEEAPASRWFTPGAVDGAFLTREYTYDARVLRDHFLKELNRFDTCEVRCGDTVAGAPARDAGEWVLRTGAGAVRAPFVLNATYASVNQVNAQ